MFLVHPVGQHLLVRMEGIGKHWEKQNPEGTRVVWLCVCQCECGAHTCVTEL